MKQGMTTLSVAEAKRLIAKGVAALPQVQAALRQGTIIIAGGTTNAYVAEELSGIKIDKGRYTAGVIAGGHCCVTPAESRWQSMVLQKGQQVQLPWIQALEELKPGDIFVKGGNAIDSDGNLGILLGNSRGGTIGKALGAISARGIEIVVPVGLEKFIPSVPAAAASLGSERINYSRGMKCGMQVITGATVVREDTALGLLSGCMVTVAAKGGIGISAGSTTLAFSGEEPKFQQALSILASVLGEKALKVETQKCPCQYPCDFGKGITRGQ